MGLDNGHAARSVRLLGIGPEEVGLGILRLGLDGRGGGRDGHDEQ